MNNIYLSNIFNMKSFYLSISLLLFSVVLSAQPGPPMEGAEFEKVEAYKVKFITDKLDLSPEEAQKFWPVYNEYTKKIKEIHQRRKDGLSRKEIKEQWEELEDAELRAIALQELQNQADIAALKRAYFEKFEAAVGSRKAATFYRLELEFHRHLMEMLGRRKGRR